MHEILITSAPDKYAPIIKSLNPVMCSQQSIVAIFLDVLDWIEDKRKSPEANSSRLTKSPLPKLFALIHSLGKDTITVEPPVTCNFLKSLLLESIKTPPRRTGVKSHT